MRYLGNKTRLIPFLMRALDRLGVEPGVAADPFSGTASVASALKRRGWRVHAGDVMATSYALQVARVELDRAPRFPAALLADAPRTDGPAISYEKLLERLQADPGEHGFVTEHYTPAGASGRRHGRMYFTQRNARVIDGVRGRIDRWSAEGLLDRPRAQLLLATLIEAADRVANTTGVYASFVKTWQPNSERPIELRPIDPTPSVDGRSGCTAYLGPAEKLLSALGPLDLLYLDPPYNGRQYPGYYHIPELLATGWDPPPTLRGKTGLIPDEDRRSDWCRKNRAETALRTLLAAADARHVLFSYNDEGLLGREAIEAALRERGRSDSYRFIHRSYRRYRSDSNGPNRSYGRDRVREQLHYARLD